MMSSTLFRSVMIAACVLMDARAKSPFSSLADELGMLSWQEHNAARESLGVEFENEFEMLQVPGPAPSATNVPTGSPTSTPTDMPTMMPTNMPTMVPTLAPTNMPTPVSTVMPTMMPTVVPTLMPTLMPSLMPTVAPTNASEGTAAPTIYNMTNVTSEAPAPVPTPFVSNGTNNTQAVSGAPAKGKSFDRFSTIMLSVFLATVLAMFAAVLVQ